VAEFRDKDAGQFGKMLHCNGLVAVDYITIELPLNTTSFS
jgi:hypothetical protein